jgi:hypothetical protein
MLASFERARKLLELVIELVSHMRVVRTISRVPGLDAVRGVDWAEGVIYLLHCCEFPARWCK